MPKGGLCSFLWCTTQKENKMLSIKPQHVISDKETAWDMLRCERMSVLDLMNYGLSLLQTREHMPHSRSGCWRRQKPEAPLKLRPPDFNLNGLHANTPMVLKMISEARQKVPTRYSWTCHLRKKASVMIACSHHGGIFNQKWQITFKREGWMANHLLSSQYLALI